MQAQELKNSVEKIDGHTKAIYIRCAVNYMQERNWKKALHEYEFLLEQFPEDPSLLEPVAFCYQNLGQNTKSLFFFQKAMKICISKGLVAKASFLRNHLKNILLPTLA